MNDTPRTNALYEQLYKTCDTVGDAGMCRKLGDLSRTLERELAAATTRAENAERDALMRAADAIQGRISAHSLGSTAQVEAHKCKSVVLALLPKERT